MTSRFSRRSVRRPAAIAILCLAAVAVPATVSWSRAAAEPAVARAGAAVGLAGAEAGAATGEAPEAAPVAGSETSSPSFVFPVAGHDQTHVISHFGDPRDGGSRTHLGIDIAAPVGTPVLAPVTGVIQRTGSGGFGGLVVWLDDTVSGRRYYFAHLDTIIVTTGQRVRAGQQLGTVGTSGNAAATRPHLHFAVHDLHDVLDPMTSVVARSTGRASPGEDVSVLRTRLRGVVLRSAPGGGHTLAVLPRHQAVSVLGKADGYYRVSHRGRMGYVAEWLLE